MKKLVHGAKGSYWTAEQALKAETPKKTKRACQACPRMTTLGRRKISDMTGYIMVVLCRACRSRAKSWGWC